MKYKVRAVADMEFEIESEDDESINGDACNHIENNRQDFKWEFDYYEKVEEQE